MPTPVQRASSGGGSVPPPEPPQGATATMAKTPFFLRRDAFERTLSAMDYFLEDSRGKSNSAPPYSYKSHSSSFVRTTRQLNAFERLLFPTA